MFPVPAGLGAMLACAALARAQARRAAEQAAAAAAPQWRDHTPARLLMTAEATWCQIHDTWQAYPHHRLVDYRLDGDTAVLVPQGCAPRALTGPGAWAHAVLLAYFRPVGPDWRTAPWLAPIREQLTR